MFDKRIAGLVVLFLLSLSLYLLFGVSGISEAGYSQLLSSSSVFAGVDVGLLRMAGLLAGFVSAAILFFSVVGIGKEFDEKSFFPALSASVLILFSSYVAMNISFLESPAQIISLPFFVLAVSLFFFANESNTLKFASIVPLAIALGLTYNQISLSLSYSVFSGFPIVIAFASLSLGYLLSEEKKKLTPEVACFVLGFIALFLLAPISLALFSYSMAQSLKRFFAEAGKIPLLLFAFCLILFITLPAGSVFNSVVSAASITVLFYLVLYLYHFEIDFLPQAIVLFSFALCFGLFYLSVPFSSVQVADESTLAGFSYALQNNLDLAVLNMPATYEFYVKDKPLLVNSKDLVSKSQPKYEYILLNSKAIPGSFAQPVAFTYITSDLQPDGTKTLVYSNGAYLLFVQSSAEANIVGEGRLYSSQGQFFGTIPFTKIKQFNKNIPLENPDSVLISISGYEDTQLYNLIMKGQTVFEQGSVKIIKVN